MPTHQEQVQELIARLSRLKGDDSKQTLSPTDLYNLLFPQPTPEERALLAHMEAQAKAGREHWWAGCVFCDHVGCDIHPVPTPFGYSAELPVCLDCLEAREKDPDDPRWSKPKMKPIQSQGMMARVAKALSTDQNST